MTINEYIEKAKAKIEDLTPDQQEIYIALLENEKKELERIAEQTTSANIDRIATVFIPAIKKLARDSVINSIVGVQPIEDRLAFVRIIDYVYSSDLPSEGISAGDSAIDKPSREYSADPGEGADITRGIDLVVREIETRARQRKLAGRWTFEGADSAAKAGINVEREITKALAAKIVEEINFEIIYDLFANASGASTNWAPPQPTDAPAVKERKEKELYYAIVDVASQIYDKTRRYPNWVLCNPRIGAYLKRSGDYVSTGSGNPTKIKRLFYQGTLNDEFDVYIVPNLSVNKILVGYKGSSELEVGAIYAPYMPLIIMDSFFNVENWQWIRSVGSFYAKAFPMTDLYGIVNIT